MRNSHALRLVPGVNWCSALSARVRLLHEVLGIRLVPGEMPREVVECVDIRQRLVRYGTQRRATPLDHGPCIALQGLSPSATPKRTIRSIRFLEAAYLRRQLERASRRS